MSGHIFLKACGYVLIIWIRLSFLKVVEIMKFDNGKFPTNTPRNGYI